MTHRQSAQINRYRALEGICDAHAAAWSAIPAFGTAKAALSAHLRTLEDAIGVQDTGTKGATAQKKLHRRTLESYSFRLAAAVRLSSLGSGDAEMAREATLTPSRLRLMVDNALLGMASRIQGWANDIGAAGLLPFGIDAAFLAAFVAEMAAFGDHIGGPQAAEADQMQATANIARLLSECKALLTTFLDPGTELVRASAPEFYAEYWVAHRIKDAATRPRALRVQVLDGATGAPVAGVRATLLPGNKVKRTGPAGRFYVQSLKSGVYNIALEQEGYAPATAEVRVQKGGRAEVVVRLQRAE